MVFSYIYNCLLNKKIDLYKRRKYFSQFTIIDIDSVDSNKIKAPEDSDRKDILMIQYLLDELPKKQKEVIINQFIKGYPEVMIAKQLHISRQAVNKLKNKALQKMKSKLISGDGTLCKRLS